MNNVVALPKRSSSKSKLIYLINRRKSNVIDLASIRKQLQSMARDISRIEAKLRLRLIQNGSAEDKHKK